MIEVGRLNPLPLISHKMNLDEAPKAYDIFDNKKDKVTKVVLKTGYKNINLKIKFSGNIFLLICYFVLGSANYLSLYYFQFIGCIFQDIFLIVYLNLGI